MGWGPRLRQVRRIKIYIRRLIARAVGIAPWSLIRSFGNVKYFNVSYGILFAIPIVHELYQRDTPLMKWIGAPAPFPITLQWIYTASLSYALAIGLYQIFCPSEIKRFGTPGEYVDSQHEIFCRAHPKLRENIVLTNLDSNLDRMSIKTIEHLHHKIEEASGNERQFLRQQLDEFILSLHPDAVQRYLIRDYEQRNVSNLLARWPALVFYIVGTFILLTLLLIRSYQVLV